MNFTKGMECPNCGVKDGFHGGHFGCGVNTVNYVCDCGFSAILIINWKKEYKYFEIKGIKDDAAE